MDGLGAAGLFLVCGLRQGIGGGNGAERLRVKVDDLQKTRLKRGGAPADGIRLRFPLGIGFFSGGQRADHGGQRRAKRALERGGGAAAGSRSLGGEHVCKFGYVQFTELHGDPPFIPCRSGDIPSPANPPKGCKFHTRCAKCMNVCKFKEPNYIEAAPNHFVACHLYDKEVMANLPKYDEEYAEILRVEAEKAENEKKVKNEKK